MTRKSLGDMTRKLWLCSITRFLPLLVDHGRELSNAALQSGPITELSTGSNQSLPLAAGLAASRRTKRDAEPRSSARQPRPKRVAEEVELGIIGRTYSDSGTGLCMTPL